MVPARAQTAAPPAIVTPLNTVQADTTIESPADGLARDASTFAASVGLLPEQAARQLRAQEASVAVTDAIAARFADRLAGIAVEHAPEHRIIVLLTGKRRVADEMLDLGGEAVPIVFHTGARATHAQLVAAITSDQAALRAALPHPPGMGVDQRTGELVLVVAGDDVDAIGADALKAQAERLTGVPVRIRALDRPGLDAAAVEGGARVVGMEPGDGRRYVCTSGFVVTDGARDGIVTAAHCPDELSYVDPNHVETPLPFVGQWGWGNQDVQVNASAQPLAPLFFADTAKTISRAVTGQRALAGMRAGDVVCHRGESTGYSCGEVELTDFAPAGDLCGGACLPTWVTVRGPGCRGGDSGAPVFLGAIAYGIVKGASYRGDRSCAFYFYMSTDFLPAGWTLLTQPVVASPQPAESGVEATP